jgi:WD40 repeat protein
MLTARSFVFYFSFLLLISLTACDRGSRGGGSNTNENSNSNSAPPVTRSKEFVMDFKNYEGQVGQLGFTPDGKLLAASTRYNDRLYLWNFPDGKRNAAVGLGTDKGVTFDFSPDGKLLATADDDDKITIWDAAALQEKTSFSPLKGIYSMAFAPDSTLFVADGYGKMLALDAATGKTKKEFTEPGGKMGKTIFQIEFSPDGNLVATSSRPDVKIWNTKTGAIIKILTGFNPSDDINLAFTPDGKTLISYSDNSLLKRWNPQTGEAVFTKDLGSTYLGSASFTKDGRFMAVSGGESKKPGVIKIYDTATGELKLSLTGHKIESMDTAFSPDGRHLVSRSGYQTDSELFLWDTAGLY